MFKGGPRARGRAAPPSGLDELVAARAMLEWLARNLADLDPEPRRTLAALEVCLEALDRDIADASPFEKAG